MASMAALLLALFSAICAAEPSAPVVFTRAYSHNDYEQPRPLFDALDRGFFGVEADVHLRGRELLIGHTGGDVKPGVTLQKLYLDPLLARVRANGGRVYPGGPPGFLLMIEFKSDGEESYPVLREILENYKEMLSIYTPDRIDEKAVTVVITGHRPNDMLKAEAARYAGIDGDLGDLKKPDATLFPVISDPWWKIAGVDSDSDGIVVEHFKKYADAAHARGRKIRFYGIPNKPWAWDIMYRAGVDYINADDLEGLRKFLVDKRTSAPSPAPAESASRKILPMLKDPFAAAP
jgi:glycerophosphoryl diester phosphodiesterase